MKTAKLHIALVEFTCPDCGEHISAESGSHLFPIFEIPETLECDCCKKPLKVPAKAKTLRDRT